MMLPPWMRGTLLATAVMNLVVAGAFLPSAQGMRALMGMPEPGHALYPLTVGLFVALFGFGYLWTAIAGRADRLFIALAAAGKTAFVLLLVALWTGGTLPLRAPLVGSADLVFALLFVRWLVGG